jgi:hypothetical protein
MAGSTNAFGESRIVPAAGRMLHCNTRVTTEGLP